MIATLPPLSVSDSRIPTSIAHPNLVADGDYLEHVGQFRASALQPEVVTRTRVVDCARCAWNEHGGADLDRGFLADYRRDLDVYAPAVLAPYLAAAWRRRGRVPLLVCHHDCRRDVGGPGEPPDELYMEVRQEAADAMPGEELVFAAGLVDEYADWVQR